LSERRITVPKDAKEDLPGTVQRSPAKAQRTYAKTLESAHDQYDSEDRAHRTAFAALKHSFEKVDDHWEAKHRKGPSDPQAKGGRKTRRQTAGGVDVMGHSKDELMQRAKKLGIRGRSRMTKMELGKAIARKQD
jgi:cation transport regulator ChaB